MVRRDGSTFPAEISLSAIDTDEGLLVSAAVRCSDGRTRLPRLNPASRTVNTSAAPGTARPGFEATRPIQGSSCCGPLAKTRARASSRAPVSPPLERRPNHRRRVHRRQPRQRRGARLVRQPARLQPGPGQPAPPRPRPQRAGRRQAAIRSRCDLISLIGVPPPPGRRRGSELGEGPTLAARASAAGDDDRVTAASTKDLVAASATGADDVGANIASTGDLLAELRGGLPLPDRVHAVDREARRARRSRPRPSRPATSSTSLGCLFMLARGQESVDLNRCSQRGRGGAAQDHRSRCQRELGRSDPATEGGLGRSAGRSSAAAWCCWSGPRRGRARPGQVQRIVTGEGRMPAPRSY